MSRRPADKATQNQQTIKSLLKLESNKTCADCKKNKHPRWASWNLGIFICIRCSGIHRGMGTHISRVKSVDLDAWTDEQLQSVLRWGNGRANKYWEAKLATGHVPSDAKMENFIRTKYESKRWVMDGPMPDPSTLGEDGGDDNVPLNVVQEKAKLDRTSSQRLASASSSQPPHSARSAQPASFDLIGEDDPVAPPVRPSTTDTTSQAPKPPQVKNQTPSQLLGGLDFLGAPPDRPASAASKPSGGMPRADLKQSILSLYASAPKPQPQQSPDAHNRQPSFGGMSAGSGQSGGQSSAYGGFNDAFAGLSFSSNSGPSAPKPQQSQAMPSSFSGFGQTSPPIKSPPAQPQMTSPQLSSAPLSGGGFFDAGPKPPPKQAAPPVISNPMAPRKISNASDGFGDFSSIMSSAPPPASKPSNNSNGLLDFTSTPMPGQSTAQPSNTSSSVFNLSSQSKPASNPTKSFQPTKPTTSNFSAGIGGVPWGNNEWAEPASAPAPAPTQAPIKQASPMTSPPVQSSGDFGWGSSSSKPATTSSDWGTTTSTTNTNTTSSSGFGASTGGWGDSDAWSTPAAPAPAPKVKPEEDFGGWSSNTEPPKPATSNKPPPAVDDPWANVWE